jgi:hypothetical protein
MTAEIRQPKKRKKPESFADGVARGMRLAAEKANLD